MRRLIVDLFRISIAKSSIACSAVPIYGPHFALYKDQALCDLGDCAPRMAVLEASNRATRILEASAVIGSFKCVMIWHPRMQTDAAHAWLRATIRELGRRLS